VGGTLKRNIICKSIPLLISAILLCTACNTAGAETAASQTPWPSALPAASLPLQAVLSPVTIKEPEPPLDPIGQLISKMTDRELIGQMVMIGFTGTRDMDPKSIALIRDHHVGNVMLFGWNTRTFAQSQKLIEKIRSYNAGTIPLTIGIDVEGGDVKRFIGQWRPRIASALDLGRSNDVQRVHLQYAQIGQKLRETGFDLDFAPVADIAKGPGRTFLGKRMFGSDPAKVAPLIQAAVQGLHDGGTASLVKHFPGHGETAQDSHRTLPVIHATLEEMRAYALIPFKAAVDAGADAVLVAHLSYPDVDSSYITSVSPLFITQILREELGFRGVVFSDDLRMQGLRKRYRAGEGAVHHILAGGDVVLIGKDHDLQLEVLESLSQAVREGRITRERLELSVRRILEMKLKYSEPTIPAQS
jgi:beta-N-acetylhexosaminidase